MKILHIIPGVDPAAGGPMEGILRQSDVWARHGHVREIVSLDLPNDLWVKRCPIRTHAMGNRSPLFRQLQRRIPWFRYNYSPHLIPWLRANAVNYDAVIVNGMWNYTAFAAMVALRKSAVPYYVFTHGQLDPWFRQFYPVKNAAKQLVWLFCEGRLLKGAKAVLFTTEEEKLLTRNAFWPYSVREHVIGYGTADVQGESGHQVKTFYECVPSLADRRFLLFLSRIHPKKGCDILIRAFARAACDYPDLDLVIAGPDQIGWRRELEVMAQELKVAHRIHWPGMLMGDAKWGAFRAAEAFLLPSHSENFGIAVAEALACRLPVLISDKVNIWREVQAHGGGLISRDADDDFTRIICEFLEKSDQEKQNLATGARAAFEAHFDIETVALRMLDYFENA
ncbi:glycosyltransferase [Methylosinus sporium]|uniref:glycosyltransferase n=1 Tax=Methylosinus sporium TaxID=428 RepID=UPI00383B8DD2